MLRTNVSLLVLAVCLAAPVSAFAQGKGDKLAPAPAGRLRFAFVRTPWQDVLQWLANSADWSLHVGAVPPGSFTYSDKRAYTPEEAMDRLNLFLIPQRYSLVRSGTLLSVVSLDDETSLRQLDAMAQTVEPQHLANLSPHELARCLFPLGEVQAEQALGDLSGLLLIREPVVLRQTNQLFVTETAGKLRMVQGILAALAATAGGGGPIKKFPLGSIDGQRALAQIRPHVGLDPVASSGPDISFSIDQDGRQLLASGSNEKLDIVAAVVQSLRSSSAAADDRKPVVFRPHPVGAADMQTVVNVLQTLLASEDVRLAPDEKSNQIALMASEEVHALVDRTIQQLASTDSIEFKAIPLGAVEPRYALAVLNAMFVSEASETSAPKIDADPLTGRLFVRGKSSQIAEIQRVLEQLGQPSQGHGSLRMLPYRGQRGRRILQAAEQFWPHVEKLLIMPSGDDETQEQPLEREINAQPRTEADPVSFRQRAEPQPPATIRGQLTPQGILIQSDAIDALDRFEKHVQQIAGLGHTSQSRLAIYYLKHTTAGEADRLLRRLLDAESAVRAKTTVLSSGGSLGTDGAWSSGTAMVIPDQRLNRMFVYGDESDLAAIQRHLEVIDRENSIADVQTSGEPRVIRLAHARAENVAAILRDAYAGRIGATAEERQQAAVQLQRLQQSIQGRRGEEAAQQPVVPLPAPDSSESPRMTLAIDQAGNSLIVTAPSQLAEEVERLARGLDLQAAQTVRVMAIKSTSPAHVRDTLGALLGDRVRSSTPSDVRAAGK